MIDWGLQHERLKKHQRFTQVINNREGWFGGQAAENPERIFLNGLRVLHGQNDFSSYCSPLSTNILIYLRLFWV